MAALGAFSVEGTEEVEGKTQDYDEGSVDRPNPKCPKLTNQAEGVDSVTTADTISEEVAVMMPAVTDAEDESRVSSKDMLSKNAEEEAKNDSVITGNKEDDSRGEQIEESCADSEKRE